MKRSTKLVIVSLSLAVILLGGTYATFAPSRPKTATVASQTIDPPTNAELLSLVNAERAKVGVKPLTEDPRLDSSAQRKALDEVQYHYFGHISPHDGKHGYEYINDVAISCKADAENLTENTHVNDASSAVNAWVNSPAHYAAMTDPDYSLTGFGIDGNQIVEHFCQQ